MSTKVLQPPKYVHCPYCRAAVVLMPALGTSYAERFEAKRKDHNANSLACKWANWYAWGFEPSWDRPAEPEKQVGKKKLTFDKALGSFRMDTQPGDGGGAVRRPK